MTTYRDLLDRPADEFKKPEVWPAGTYLCKVGRVTFNEPRDDSKSAMYNVSFRPIKPYEAPDGSIDIEDDLSEYTERWGKDQFYRRFPVTAETLHRFTKGFAKDAVGLNITGKTTRQLAEELPDKLVGVVVRVGPSFSNPDEPENQVQSFIAV